MESIWKKTAELPEFHTLTKDIRTKVLIIGGGMAGILCAYFLQRSGVDYCLLEADTICSGVTGNTTAKITSQHGLIYDSCLLYTSSGGVRDHVIRECLSAFPSGGTWN